MDADQHRNARETIQGLSSTERTVAELWCEALQMTELPTRTDNFFALGGDSMTMTMVEFRIKEELSIELLPGALLGAQTLAELSSLIERMTLGASNNLTPPVETGTT